MIEAPSSHLGTCSRAPLLPASLVLFRDLTGALLLEMELLRPGDALQAPAGFSTHLLFHRFSAWGNTDQE